MTAPITLGWVAPKQTVVLDRDSDFLTELRPTIPFPDGTEIYIEWKFGGTIPAQQWDATVTPEVASIYKTKAEVGAMLDARPVSSKLHHKRPDGPDLTWYRGEEPRDRT